MPRSMLAECHIMFTAACLIKQNMNNLHQVRGTNYQERLINSEIEDRTAQKAANFEYAKSLNFFKIYRCTSIAFTSSTQIE